MYNIFVTEDTFQKYLAVLKKLPWPGNGCGAAFPLVRLCKKTTEILLSQVRTSIDLEKSDKTSCTFLYYTCFYTRYSRILSKLLGILS